MKTPKVKNKMNGDYEEGGEFSSLEETQSETPKRRTQEIEDHFHRTTVGSGMSPFQFNWNRERELPNDCRSRTPLRINHSSSGSSSEGATSKLGRRFILSSSSSSGGSALECDLKGMNLMNQSCNTLRSKDDPSQSPAHSSASDHKPFSTPNCTTSVSRGHNRCLNPFESDLIETINCSSLTPSVFSKVLTPSRCELNDVFSWGVDNVAVLYPAEIEENPLQDASPRPLDVEMEERLQHAINSFFAQKSFAPSPWLENDGAGPAVRLSPTHVSLQTSGHGSSLSSEGEKRKSLSLAGSKAIRSQKKDVWCQTVLSLPVNFELDHVLDKYFTFREDQMEQGQESNLEGDENREPLETDSRDGLSLSSLRRKLFASDDKEPSTPSRTDHPVSRSALSPRTPDREMCSSPTVTASSPIVQVGQRTTMTPPNNIASPAISPIGCFVSMSEDADISCMSTGPSRTNTPRTDQLPAPVYFDDLGILRQDLSYSERIDKMARHVLPSLCTGQEGTVKARQSCRVRVTLPSTRFAAAEEANSSNMLFMDVMCDVGRAAGPFATHQTNLDSGYRTMSSCQDSGQSTSCGVPPRPTTSSVNGSPPKTPSLKTTDDPFYDLKGEKTESPNAMESSVSNTSSSAMMWSPIGASTPSSTARFAS